MVTIPIEGEPAKYSPLEYLAWHSGVEAKIFNEQRVVPDNFQPYERYWLRGWDGKRIDGTRM